MAILAVCGGPGNAGPAWLGSFLRQVGPVAGGSPRTLYLWNGLPADPDVAGHLSGLDWVTVIDGAPYDRPAHPLAVPLQRLYTLAREQGAHTVVTLGLDTLAGHSDWLARLTGVLAGGAALAGVWYDNGAGDAYVHPCCLATTVGLIDRFGLRFDRIPVSGGAAGPGGLIEFTRAAEGAGLPVHRLRRGNANAFHPVLGGLYGDLIYHHGVAGLGGSPWSDGDPAAAALLADPEGWLAWLRGLPAGARQDRPMAKWGRQLAEWERRSSPPVVPPRTRWRKWARWVADRVPGGGRLIRRRRPGGAGSPSRLKMIRPIQPADLHPVPHNWRVEGPDFVGVGAQKAGTSWWYSLLAAHPQVVASRVRFHRNKELHYFDHFPPGALGEGEAAFYRGIFAAPPGAVCGEFTPNYLCRPGALESLAAAAPETRIIVLLRNPIDRLQSFLNHVATQRADWFEGLDPTRVRLFQNYPILAEAVLHGLYAPALRRLSRLFPQERVLVLQYEACRADPVGQLARTYGFLGLDEGFIPVDIDRRVNAAAHVRPPFSAAERAHWAAYYADDVRQTVGLRPEVDLAWWPEFMGRER